MNCSVLTHDPKGKAYKFMITCALNKRAATVEPGNYKANFFHSGGHLQMFVIKYYFLTVYREG
jgi:hypothetical protein